MGLADPTMAEFLRCRKVNANVNVAAIVSPIFFSFAIEAIPPSQWSLGLRPPLAVALK